MAFYFLSKMSQDPTSMEELMLQMERIRWEIAVVEEEKNDFEEKLENERYVFICLLVSLTFCGPVSLRILFLRSITKQMDTFLAYTEHTLAAKKMFLEQKKNRDMGKEDLKKALEKEATDFEKVSLDRELLERKNY